MTNLPKDWKEEKLEKLVVSKKGNKPKELFETSGENLVPYIDIKAFEKNIIERYARKDKSKLTKEGNILVVWDGARSGLVGKAQYEGAIGSTLVDLSPVKIDANYLHRFIQTQYRYINSNPRGTGIPHVDPNIFWNIDVPIAPLPEQKQIAKKLDKLIDRVEKANERLNKIPQILKRFRQAVLTQAVTGELTKLWREENSDIESAEELLKRIVIKKEKIQTKIKKTNKIASNFDHIHLPEIPKTWAWSYLQNLGELSRGKSKHRPRNDLRLFGGNYPFIQTGDVARSNDYIASHTQTYSEFGLAQSRLFPTNTLCITIAANIADTGILTYPACFPDSVVGFIPEKGMFEVFFVMYFIQVVQNDIATFAPATAQKNINLEILRSISVPVPPLKEQQEIVKKVKALFAVADRIEERYKKAKTYTDKLTQSILNKAFRGKLVSREMVSEALTVENVVFKAEKYWKEKGRLDIKDFARQNNILVYSSDNIDAKAEAVYNHEKNIFEICVKDPQDNYSVAHEIAHIVLHPEKLKIAKAARKGENSLTKAEETEAENLAAEMLMPENLVIEYLAEQGIKSTEVRLDEKFVRSCAKKFDVSTPAMNFRLKNLGYKVPYIKH